MENMIVPADVLVMAPSAAAELVASLDETHQYALFTELVRIAKAAPLPKDQAAALGAAFGALRRALLKLHFWYLMSDNAQASPHAFACLRAVHMPMAKVITTSIFGVPFGAQGVGVKPQAGLTVQDAADVAMSIDDMRAAVCAWENARVQAQLDGTLRIQTSSV